VAGSLGALAGFQAFSRLSGADRRAAVVAFLALAFWRIALLLVPWRVVARWVARGRPAPARRDDTWPATVRRAIARASRVPAHPTCLVQALAGVGMLRRGGFPATLCLGVRRGDDARVAAHAWLECGGAVVTGDVEALQAYSELLRIDDAARPLTA